MVIVEWLEVGYYILCHPRRFHKWWSHGRKFNIGDIVVDCRGHPCEITAIDYDWDGLTRYGCDLRSLLDSSPYSCSFRHCGVYHPTDEEIEQRRKAWFNDGNRGLAMLDGWTAEGYDEFEKVWGKPITIKEDVDGQ